MSVAVQRPIRGQRLSAFYPTISEIPPLSSLESAFQLQEYITLLIRHDAHDVDNIVAIPGTRPESEKGKEVASGETDGGEGKEFSVDEHCWIYEHLRRLAQDLTHPLITALQQECTRGTCPEMKAGEWLYLCVAHGNVSGNNSAMEQCCAIDYILHTLDSATALLNSPRVFPSRLSIPRVSAPHFSSLARRLGRIFAHAYFHHRDTFEAAEAESALYARFLALVTRFDLVPAEFLVIPPRMEPSLGGEEGGYGGPRRAEVDPPRLMGAAVNVRLNSEHIGQRGNEDESPFQDPPVAGLSSERRDPSPAKMGRSRTDTMVLHDGPNLVGDGVAPALSQESIQDALPEGPPAPLTEEPVAQELEKEKETERAEEETVPLDNLALMEKGEGEAAVASGEPETPEPAAEPAPTAAEEIVEETVNMDAEAVPAPPAPTPEDAVISGSLLSHPVGSEELAAAIEPIEGGASGVATSASSAEIPHPDTLIELAPPGITCVVAPTPGVDAPTTEEDITTTTEEEETSSAAPGSAEEDEEKELALRVETSAAEPDSEPEMEEVDITTSAPVSDEEPPSPSA